MNDERRLVALALSRVTALRPAERLHLACRWQRPGDLLGISADRVAGLLRRRMRESSWEPSPALELAGKDLRLAETGRIGLLFLGDPDYPAPLAEIYDPPLVLYLRGEPGALHAGTALGIVGTRRPTGAARQAAYEAGEKAAELGLTVVSGLARGVDRHAHQGAVAANGTAVAVLGTGIDRIYPKGSLAAAAAILDAGGVLVSEYGPGIPPHRHQFPARNRIISGLSRGVLVVQAPERSGALITAEYALEQGRDLFVHAKGVYGPLGAGTGELADQGASVVESVAQIAADWGIGGAGRQRIAARQEGNADDVDGDGEPPRAGSALQTWWRGEMHHG